MKHAIRKTLVAVAVFAMFAAATLVSTTAPAAAEYCPSGNGYWGCEIVRTPSYPGANHGTFYIVQWAYW